MTRWARVIYVVTFSKMLFPRWCWARSWRRRRSSLKWRGSGSCDLGSLHVVAACPGRVAWRGEFQPGIWTAPSRSIGSGGMPCPRPGAAFPPGAGRTAGGGFNMRGNAAAGRASGSSLPKRWSAAWASPAAAPLPPAAIHRASPPRLLPARRRPVRRRHRAGYGASVERHVDRRHTALVRATRRASPLV